MFCENCGNKVNEGNMFCRNCGQQVVFFNMMPEMQPVQKKKRRKKSVIAKVCIGVLIFSIFIGIIVLVVGLANKLSEANDRDIDRKNYSSTTVEGPGYASADEAFKAYLEAMKKGDVNGMLSTFAIETYVDNIDLVERTETIGGYTVNTMPPLEPIDRYTRAIDVEKRRSGLVTAFLMHYYYLTGSDLYECDPIGFGDDWEYNTARDFFSDLSDDEWMKKLSELNYELLSPKELEQIFPDKYSEEKIRESCKDVINRQCLGCDELVSNIAIIKFDGEEYYFNMDIVRYGDRWYNYQTWGSAAGICLEMDPSACGFFQ